MGGIPSIDECGRSLLYVQSHVWLVVSLLHSKVDTKLGSSEVACINGDCLKL